MSCLFDEGGQRWVKCSHLIINGEDAECEKGIEVTWDGEATVTYTDDRMLETGCDMVDLVTIHTSCGYWEYPKRGGKCGKCDSCQGYDQYQEDKGRDRG